MIFLGVNMRLFFSKYLETKIRALRKVFALYVGLFQNIRHSQSLNNVIFYQMIAHLNCKEAVISLARSYKFGVNVVQDNDNLQRYLECFRPHKHNALKLQRYGGLGDGGYNMLPPPCNKNEVQPIALSLGVSYYAPWDLELADMGYKVLEFDASVPQSPYPNHKNIIFFKKFVGINETHDTIGLDQIIKEHDFNRKAHNIMQCDIEDAEWDILEKIDMNLITDNFSQILFEFHNCYPDDTRGISQRLRVLEKINESYVPIWTHYNNSGGLLIGVINNEVIPFCPSVEVTYLRRDLLPPDSVMVIGLANVLPEPNNFAKPDIPVFFPKM